MKPNRPQEKTVFPRWILHILCSICLILTFASLAPAADPGDANGDGRISYGDLTAIVNQILGQGTSPGTPDCNSDGHVNIQDVVCLINILNTLPPPDPGEVAPPVDPTVATNLFTATEFLYTTGIQTGVAPGTIDPKRVAVLRGKVFDRDGNVLPGATITVLNHPEFGQTLSRTDGMFDLAVNGGGYLTVKYQKSGYLEVQRQLNVPWQNYVWAPDVALIQLDSQAAVIDLNAAIPFQVAQGSVTSDNRGTRQSTLLFAQGTQAEIILPNGSTQPISNLTVRSTEYTVGENGPKAMPAELPPGVGYTYAVELSVDEAMTAGASEVRFNQPVIHYVENLLGFAAGAEVPAYYYDRKQSRWVPFPNGRVIKILTISNNMVNLDVDGDDVVDTGVKLTDLGITDAERQKIATLYSAGQSLWRVALRHLTPYDYNYGWQWPPDAGPPQPEVKPEDKPEDDPCASQGSIIECQNQTLGESIGVTGTPFTLNYRSNRVPGRGGRNRIIIPLTRSRLDYEEFLVSVDLYIMVAGRRFHYSYLPQPNLSHTFTWDGLDAYGRKLQGAHWINVSVNYTYQARRCAGSTGECIISPNIYDDLSAYTSGKIEAPWDFRRQTLGVWSLNVHHAYDPTEQTLYLGTGDQRSAVNQAWVVDTVAGNGEFCDDYTQPCGDGGKATDAQLYPWGVDVGPDGSLYITDEDAYRIWRAWPDGTITVVAGNKNNQWCHLANPTDPCGDGGPATQASFGDIYQSVVGPDGSIYIADEHINRIRKVRPDGIITTVAGTGERGFGGDGGPATQAKLNEPYGIRVAPDGSLYIADTANHRIRRVRPDGIITTVAGNGTDCSPWWNQCSVGDGGPATQATVGGPLDVAVGRDGSLYIPSRCRIRKVSPDGIISTVAGTNQCDYSGDGGLAVNASLWPGLGIAVLPDGTILFTDNNRVRRITPDGIISTIAGIGYPRGYNGDNGPATATKFFDPWYIAIGPNGHIYIADAGNLRLRRMRPLLPDYSGQEIVISSSDGKELYFFDPTGRHLKTVSILTGATLYEFTYDSQGKVTQVKDGDNNVTNIERDTSGNPTAIIGPYGQRTTLALDANGSLSGITNPAGETTIFQYTSDGLMTRMTTPRGHAYNYTYDSMGRLISDEDPGGGSQTLARTELANGYEVTRTTALGRTTTYRVENLSTGDKRNINLFPNGLQAEALYKTDGTDQTTFPDGIRTVGKPGPDPRFGMQVPIAQSFSVSVPSGLSLTASATRTVTLSDPTNPLSLQTQNDTVNINGQSHATSYDGTTRRYTARSPVGREFSTTLNEKGDAMEVLTLGHSPVRYLYDPSGRMTNFVKGTGTNERVTAFSYGTDGFLNQVIDPLNQTHGFSRDAAGRVLTYTSPDGSSVTFTYDQNGDVLTVAPPDRPAHSYTYAPDGLIVTYTAPAVGSENSTTQYAYNADQQLSSIIHPDGKMIAFAYDGSGRLSSMTLQEGAITRTYSSSTGALTALVSPGGVTLDFTYDGFLPTGETWSGPVTGTVSKVYGPGLRMNSISVNGSQTTGLQYDPDGLLTQAGSLIISNSTQNDSITGTALGGVSTSLTYNTFGELVGESGSYNSSVLLDIQYVRDKLGRISQKTETIQGSTDTYAYNYDINGRLTEVRRNGATISSYTYDSNGNRTGASLGSSVNGTYDVQDRLAQYGSTTYTYTANGELQSKTEGGQITTYQYDALGNLRQVTLPTGTVISYVIDGRNRRIGKRVNGTLTQGFLYKNALKPIAELDGTNTLRSLFIYGTRGNVPDYMVRDGNTYRILSDHLGSPRLVVNTSTGDIAQRTDYDEFGNVTQDTNQGFQPFGFAGGLFDNQTGLLRFGARDYDPGIGRWTTKDHEGFSQGYMNRYAYVDSDPVNWHDPDGQAKVDVKSFPSDNPEAQRLLKKVEDALNKLSGKSEGEEWKTPPKKLARKSKEHLDKHYKDIWEDTVISYNDELCGTEADPRKRKIVLDRIFLDKRWKRMDLEKVILHEYLHESLKEDQRRGEEYEHIIIDHIIKDDLGYPGPPNPAKP